MKLQMISEEISTAFDEQASPLCSLFSLLSRRHLPSDDALSLRQSVAYIILKLKKAEGSSTESIATLEKIDTVKRIMEAAYETLQVTKFSNVRKQLEVLEDRLDTIIQHRLIDAPANRKGEVAQYLRGIFIRIGRFKFLELYYAKVHLKSIKQLWKNFDAKQQTNRLPNAKSETLSNSHDHQLGSAAISLFSWLQSFYEELLLYLEQ